MSTSLSTIKQAILKNNQPALYWEDELKRIISEFRAEIAIIKREVDDTLKNLQKDAKNAIKDATEDVVFGGVEPAKIVAQKVAENEIKLFKITTNQQVKDILDNLKKSKDELTEKMEIQARNKYNDLKAQIDKLIEKTNSEIEQLSARGLDDRAEIQTIIENVAKMRGPQGERGEAGVSGKDGISGKDGKDGSPDQPKQIASKLNSLNEVLEISVIKGLKGQLSIILRSIRDKAGGGGGIGMPVHQTFTGNGVLTSFTLTYGVAANGKALWAYYNGQFLVNSTHWSVSGTTLSLTFTPANGSSVDVTYLRG